MLRCVWKEYKIKITETPFLVRQRFVHKSVIYYLHSGASSKEPIDEPLVGIDGAIGSGLAVNVFGSTVPSKVHTKSFHQEGSTGSTNYDTGKKNQTYKIQRSDDD